MTSAWSARVLITAPSGARVGGVAVYCAELKREAPDEIVIVTVGSRGAGDPVWRSIGRLVADGARVGREILRTRPAVVHLNPSLDLRSAVRDGLSLTIARACGRRPIVFLHGWSASNARRVSRLHGLPARILLDRAGAVVVLAKTYGDDLRGWGVTVPVYIESTMVPADTLAALDDAGDRRAAGPHTGMRLLVLGRVTARKGIWTAVKAARLARDEGADVRLVFAGDGAELPKLRSWARDEAADWVTCLGEVRGEAKIEALRGADAMLMPSHTEGMPLALLEGMAAGLPIVTTQVGGVRDFFVDGEMGWSCPPNDVRALAAAILKLAAHEDSWPAMGGGNRSFVVRHFTASQVWRRLRRIYSGRPAVRSGGRDMTPWYERPTSGPPPGL